MAPIKFEENIREKLEERIIKPSPKSWDALANRLDEAPVKKSVKRSRVIGMAASFIGVLLLITGIVNYNDKESFKMVDTDVETKNDIVKDKIKDDKKINLLESSKKEERIVDVKNKTNNNIKKETLKTQREQLIQKRAEGLASVGVNNNVDGQYKETNTDIINTNKNKRDSNAQQSTTNKAYIASNTQREGSKEKLLKITTVLGEKQAEASNANNQIVQVTDSELDALLNNAQRDIAKKTSNPVPLDYNELLQDVEDNLEESFRDKILKTVKGGYHSVKSYVAERNE